MLTTFETESRKYEVTLNSDYKKSMGIFYTDTKLADLMLSELSELITKETKIIDPTCGSGIFLKVAIEKGYKNVYGTDIDKGAVRFAGEFIPEAKILKLDSLSLTYDEVLRSFKTRERFDLVIGNPPYAPISKDNQIITNDYLFLRTVSATGDNLFNASLIRARDLVKEGGIISYIIPKNFLHVNSYSLLRRDILRDFTILSIVDIGKYFKKVKGEQIILTIKKGRVSNSMIAFKKLNYDSFELKTLIDQSFYNDEIVFFDSNEDFNIYNKLKNTYSTLSDIAQGYIGRGRSKDDDAISGRDIRKFGLKVGSPLREGNQIFIQNIYSAESGIIACFGGNLKASETVTVFTDGDPKMCRYVLGILHSRLCNFYLQKYAFNSSKLTMHVDSKYLKKIPFLVDTSLFDVVLEYVDLLENSEYMSEKWFSHYERLNSLVYKLYGISKDEIEFIEHRVRAVQSRKWDINERKES